VCGVDGIDCGLQHCLLGVVFLHCFFERGHLLLQWLHVLHLLIHGIKPSQDTDVRLWLMLAEATHGTRGTKLSPVRGSHRLLGIVEHRRYLNGVGGRGPGPHRHDSTVASHQKGRVQTESASRPIVDFGVLNDNLIKGLTSCEKWISRF
jgi:hypothetical protein